MEGGIWGWGDVGGKWVCVCVMCVREERECECDE